MNDDTEIFIEQVERQFTEFMTKTVKGLKLDYYRKRRRTDLEIPTEYPDLYRQLNSIDFYCEIGSLEVVDVQKVLATLSKKQ